MDKAGRGRGVEVEGCSALERHLGEGTHCSRDGALKDGVPVVGLDVEGGEVEGGGFAPHSASTTLTILPRYLSAAHPGQCCKKKKRLMIIAMQMG